MHTTARFLLGVQTDPRFSREIHSPSCFVRDFTDRGNAWNVLLSADSQMIPSSLNGLSFRDRQSATVFSTQVPFVRSHSNSSRCGLEAWVRNEPRQACCDKAPPTASRLVSPRRKRPGLFLSVVVGRWHVTRSSSKSLRGCQGVSSKCAQSQRSSALLPAALRACSLGLGCRISLS